MTKKEWKQLGCMTPGYDDWKRGLFNNGSYSHFEIFPSGCVVGLLGDKEGGDFLTDIIPRDQAERIVLTLTLLNPR